MEINGCVYVCLDETMERVVLGCWIWTFIVRCSLCAQHIQMRKKFQRRYANLKDGSKEKSQNEKGKLSCLIMKLPSLLMNNSGGNLIEYWWVCGALRLPSHVYVCVAQKKANALNFTRPREFLFVFAPHTHTLTLTLFLSHVEWRS